MVWRMSLDPYRAEATHTYSALKAVGVADHAYRDLVFDLRDAKAHERFWHTVVDASFAAYTDALPEGCQP